MRGILRASTIPLFALFLLATACTKERPTKAVPKFHTTEKQFFIDGSKEPIIYVASTENSPRSAGATRPHWQGQEKLVKFEMNEHELLVLNLEKDDRFLENPTNAKPILSVPIEHVDYKCTEDNYGDCTNKEEENEDIPWQQKRYIKLDLDAMASLEVDLLPIHLDNLFGNCQSDIGTRFVGMDLTQDSLNFQIEKTYKSNLDCVSLENILTYFEDFSRLTYSVQYNFSLVKLASLASKDYQPIEYTPKDQGAFGYFLTETHHLDVDNNDVVKSKKELINRWMPSRTVPYYLSENFDKPEYASIKAATVQAVDTINGGLEQAGTPLRIELKDPVKGMIPGDLRNSMIVMVEDPQALNVIGYGPSVANPLTGEILQARTVMYLGTMKKFVRYTYDEMVKLKKAEEVKEKEGEAPSFQLAKNLLPVERHGSESTSQEVQKVSALNSLITNVFSSIGNGFTDDGHLSQQLRDQALNPRLRVDNTLLLDRQKYLDELMAHNQYPAELFNFEAAIEPGIQSVIEEVGSEPWDQLSADQKNLVVAKLLPYVWTPTLIHELGHNLGLRHNFAGSEDEANFYNDEELAQMGATQPFKYSSIMDYAYHTTNELRVLGKYDIAALRYGYTRQVELATGEFVAVDALAELGDPELKPYGFCTDEHVSANPNCNRFDEGTNLLEIAQHLIQAYEEGYQRRYYRNHRRSFSLLSEYSHMSFVNRTFLGLRLMFERYESIKNNFDLADNDPIWEELDFLKQLKEATFLGARFMMDVLKVPDSICAIAPAESPEMIIGIIPLKEISSFAIDCFDKENLGLRPEYVVAAQAGKSFASRKSQSNPNPYAEEIDLRGIWIDKLLAAHYLYTRELGSSLFDKYTDNYLHLPGLAEEMQKSLAGLLFDEHEGLVFRTITGEAFAIPFWKYTLGETHQILEPTDQRLTRSLGLPNEPTFFHRQLLRTAMKEIPDTIHSQVTRGFVESITVYTKLPDGRDDDEVKDKIEVGSLVYSALPENKVALDLMTRIKDVRALSLFSQAELIRALDLIVAAEAGEVLEPIEGVDDSKLVEVTQPEWKEKIQRFLEGGYRDEVYYTQVLEALPGL